MYFLKPEIFLLNPAFIPFCSCLFLSGFNLCLVLFVFLQSLITHTQKLNAAFSIYINMHFLFLVFAMLAEEQQNLQLGDNTSLTDLLISIMKRHFFLHRTSHHWRIYIRTMPTMNFKQCFLDRKADKKNPLVF